MLDYLIYDMVYHIGWEVQSKGKKKKTRSVVLRPDLFIAAASVSQLMVKFYFLLVSAFTINILFIFNAVKLINNITFMTASYL